MDGKDEAGPVPLAARVGKSRAKRLAAGWCRREVIIPDTDAARAELAAAVEKIKKKHRPTQDNG